MGNQRPNKIKLVKTLRHGSHILHIGAILTPTTDSRKYDGSGEGYWIVGHSGRTWVVLAHEAEELFERPSA